MTSDLSMQKWAVISSQGCEATSVTHEEARRLVHRLASEGRKGLCIISDDAANRMLHPASSASNADVLKEA